MEYKRELKIKADYLTLAAKEWGDSSGPPVMALHGWLDNAASFDRLAEFLPDLHFLALDFAGHGFSDHRPLGVGYHFVDYAKDVMAAADSLGWDKFILLGHSLGAAVSSIVAGSFPERISKLILIEGLGPIRRELNDSPEYLAESIRQMISFPRQKFPVYDDLDELVKLRSETGGLKEELAALLVKRSLKKTGKSWTWRSDRRLKFISPLYLTGEQVNAFLRKIEAPALLIAGKSGRLADHEYFEERYSLLKNADVFFAEGGHHLHMENPRPVADAISGFIREGE